MIERLELSEAVEPLLSYCCPLPRASCLFYISTFRDFPKRGSVTAESVFERLNPSTYSGKVFEPWNLWNDWNYWNKKQSPTITILLRPTSTIPRPRPLSFILLPLSFPLSRPLHVVVADNAEDKENIVITVYEPDLSSTGLGTEGRRGSLFCAARRIEPLERAAILIMI